MDTFDWKIVVLIFSPILSFIGAFIATWIQHRREIQFKKKELVASAYRVAMERIESLYRIKRRSNDSQQKEVDTIKIRDILHQIQTDTAYYESLLSLESRELGDAYKDLVNEIKIITADKMRQAWIDDGSITGQYDKIDASEMGRIRDKEVKFLQVANKFINKKLWTKIK